MYVDDERLRLSHHGRARTRQRGLSTSDLQLIEAYGTQSSEGYVLTIKDVDEIEVEHRQEIARLRRLQGAALVVRDGIVVTVLRNVSRVQRRRLLGARG